jgi:hypothetical protein
VRAPSRCYRRLVSTKTDTYVIEAPSITIGELDTPEALGLLGRLASQMVLCAAAGREDLAVASCATLDAASSVGAACEVVLDRNERLRAAFRVDVVAVVSCDGFEVRVVER